MTDDKDLIRDDIEAYLAKYRKKELLRFVSVGSVDDGKSTLIGRILYDTGMVFEDQMAAVRAASQSDEPDLALLTDGLKAEREQGITIDVAYRYFATDKRKFIIADTPGHIQYTRNMVTGASTADVALILIDARHGVLQQSRRHAYIASLLGIPHLAVCVNKMDLSDYSQEVFDEISADFTEFGKTLRFKDIQFFPVSALVGDNVVSDSENTPWYDGPSVLGYLETVPVFEDRNFDDFRYPVQYVIRPDLDYRGFAAEVASGVIAKGDDIVSLPSGKTSKVSAIDTYDGGLEEAFAGQSVTIRLEDEIDISRGDMIVKPGNLPRVTRRFDAHLVWMHEKPLDTEKAYLVKHTTQTVRAQIDKIHFEVDMDTLEEKPTDGVELNDIAKVRLSCHRALYVDDYQRNRETGSFIVIDTLTNNTVAAGMIVLEGADQEHRRRHEGAARRVGDAAQDLRQPQRAHGALWTARRDGLAHRPSRIRPLDPCLRARAKAFRRRPDGHRGDPRRRGPPLDDLGCQGGHRCGPDQHPARSRAPREKIAKSSPRESVKTASSRSMSTQTWPCAKNAAPTPTSRVSSPQSRSRPHGCTRPDANRQSRRNHHGSPQRSAASSNHNPLEKRGQSPFSKGLTS